jgi:hypothetical protein
LQVVNACIVIGARGAGNVGCHGKPVAFFRQTRCLPYMFRPALRLRLEDSNAIKFSRRAD